jgi:hypothetical protein
MKSSLLVIFILLANVVSQAKDKQPEQVSKDLLAISTEHGNFVLTKVVYSGGKMLGSVRNDTDRGWRYASFKVRLFDKDKRIVVADDDKLEVADLQKGATKDFTDEIGRSPAEVLNVEFHAHSRVTDFEIIFDSDHSYYDSKYVFSLIKPKLSQTLEFEDELIAIVLDVGTKQIGFTMQNKTDNPISIDWNQISYIDLSGTAHRVIHQGVKLIDRDKPQAQTVIPPTAKIVDFVYPADLVTWRENDWEELPLLPPSQEALQHKGQTFGVFIPLEINGQKKNYLFTVKIVDVQI